MTSLAPRFALRQSQLFWAGLGLLTTLHACAASHDGPDVQLGPSPQPDAGTDASQGHEGACPEENPFCEGAPPDGGSACGHAPIDLTPAGVNIMVAVDGAASMAAHWPRIKNAMQELRKSQSDAAMGLHVFWGLLVEDLNAGLAKSNWCGNTENRVLDVGDHDAQSLTDFLGSAPPGPSFLGGLYETAPVIEPLNYYMSQAGKLADPKRTNYLLFITNGNDNCFGSVYVNKHDKLLAYEKLAVELRKLNIRLIPIGFDAAAKPDASGNWGTSKGNTDFEVLSTMLEHGGSGLSEVPRVDNPDKLAEVLTEVGKVVRNCRFTIPAALDPQQSLNPFQLDFTVNGKLVPRDRSRSQGWNFVDGDTSQVELFGQACQAVQAEARLEAHKTCTENVCGTAALKVETRPRAVLYMLDSSASRIECTDGTLGCLVPPNIPPEIFTRSSLTYWETVQQALGQSLIAPINDDIDFGLQFFPSKQAQHFSCEVAPAPEIPPEAGTEIRIMSQMLEKLPFGRTPVVQALENVAASPGTLADPGVQGAVVLLTDGGDNCAGVPQEELVQRLADAARSLHERGVKTYVVRFGSASGRTPEQDAQLRAIVANGGTARSDPADMSKVPYVDAKDATELNAALAEISDTLATCSFGLGELPEDADRQKANLYLNGEAIPFDSKDERREGWGWLDAEQTTVQLYGASCEAFKTNRKTSTVVEFGCAQIAVF